MGILAIQALTGLQPLHLPRDTKSGQLLWRDKARVSEGLADVLDKMVQFHFSERYQSADEALDFVKNLTFTALYWFKRGDGLVVAKDYEEGVAAYDQAIKIKFDYYEAWYNRGIALRQLKSYEEAIASYDRAIKIQPDYYQAWYSRGLVLDELGKFEEAIASFEQAIKIQPNYYEALYNRGTVLDELGRSEEVTFGCIPVFIL